MIPQMTVVADLTRSEGELSLKPGYAVGDCHARRLPSVREHTRPYAPYFGWLSSRSRIPACSASACSLPATVSVPLTMNSCQTFLPALSPIVKCTDPVRLCTECTMPRGRYSRSPAAVVTVVQSILSKDFLVKVVQPSGFSHSSTSRACSALNRPAARCFT